MKKTVFLLSQPEQICTLCKKISYHLYFSRSLQLPTAHCSLLIAHYSLLSRVLASSQRWGMEFVIRRQMLTHFPTVTQSTGFQPEPLLTGIWSMISELWAVSVEWQRYSYRWKAIPTAYAGSLIDYWLLMTDYWLLLRLEAYTLSNRGRSLRIADSQSAGWKSVPIHIIAESLTFRLYFAYI